MRIAQQLLQIIRLISAAHRIIILDWHCHSIVLFNSLIRANFLLDGRWAAYIAIRARLLGHLQRWGIRCLISGRIQCFLDPAAISKGLVSIGFLVVFFVQDDARERLVDPGGPLVETLVDLLTLLKQLVPVKCHYVLWTWMTQYEGQDSHFKEFAFGFLSSPTLGLPRGVTRADRLTPVLLARHSRWINGIGIYFFNYELLSARPSNFSLISIISGLNHVDVARGVSGGVEEDLRPLVLTAI